jgi:hypothetical protein
MSDAGYEDDEVNAFICISKGKFKYHESGEFKIERFLLPSPFQIGRAYGGDLLASAHRAERERDRYKALAEGERERIANIMRYHTHANKNAIDAILGLPAPSLPAPEERQPADKDRDG